ncbi:MAG: FadR family transcriptional regulator [Gammaproteobacteria bacterium]|jgi:GntR family transcriptional repressor for pyruvate dehydrogenase complex|nr:FadR family transcriptional regulator [Gammaproteobacteria bacterium]MBT3696762.1 FadR family transcriptional regulator [Gammaproteobacteria bacterium]MBT5333126.1 FadR family transcriptional regulator [Gammaproteobacteria bacterium]MBT5681725.1 FadR family transcriptional regulator [Gammaproteobacteria bacterium]MBT6025627.1 FadR family transcriptional regulator [Gammaproteobacteria bacterium]
MTTKHDQISDTLTEDILQGRYRAGERLPSERDLSARFDANRGAVREAMKRLEQLGVVDVQPGGARVKDTNQASLDVIGHLLNQGDLPDRHLVDQILVVINALVSIAAEQLVKSGRDIEIEEMRGFVKAFFKQALSKEAHSLARITLMQKMLQSSHNLPLQIIARTLFEQFAPSMAPLSAYARVDNQRFAQNAKILDLALEKRDLAAVRAAFDAFSELNRETMVAAFDLAQSTPGQEANSL